MSEQALEPLLSSDYECTTYLLLTLVITPAKPEYALDLNNFIMPGFVVAPSGSPSLTVVPPLSQNKTSSLGSV